MFHVHLLYFGCSGLTTLVLSNNQISGKTAKMLLDILLNGESCLQVLDLSNNKVSAFIQQRDFVFIISQLCIKLSTFQITGWLSHFEPGSINCITSDQQNNKSLKSLRVLKLRYQLYLLL